MAFELRDRQVDAAKSWYRESSLPKEVKDYQPPIDYEELIGDMNLAKLHEIFKNVLKRQEDKIDPIRSNFGKIEKDEINMEEKQIYIEDYVKNHKTFSFRNLLEKQGSKMEVIVTFMAILEMMKQGVISIVQEETFSDIIITSALAA
jgi:segregation and condensation protein A